MSELTVHHDRLPPYYKELTEYFSDPARRKRVVDVLELLDFNREKHEGDAKLYYPEFVDKFGFDGCLYLAIHELSPAEGLQGYESLHLAMEDYQFGSLRNRAVTMLNKHYLAGKMNDQQKRLACFASLGIVESSNININTQLEAADLLNRTFQIDLFDRVTELAGWKSHSTLGDALAGVVANSIWKSGKIYKDRNIYTPHIMQRGDFATNTFNLQFVDKETIIPGWWAIANEFNEHSSALAIEVAALNGLTKPAYASKLKREGLHLLYPASGSDIGPLYLTMILSARGQIDHADLYYTEIHDQPLLRESLHRLQEKTIIQKLNVSGGVWNFEYRRIPMSLVLDVASGDPDWAGGRNPIPQDPRLQFNFLYLHDLQVHGQIRRSDPKSWAAAIPKSQVIGQEIIVLTQGEKQGFLQVHEGKRDYAASDVLEIGLDFGDEASAVLAKITYR